MRRCYGSGQDCAPGLTTTATGSGCSGTCRIQLRAWDRLGRDQGELYRGARLEQALAWQLEYPGDLNPLKEEFLGASRVLRDSEQQAERERLAQQARQNRRLASCC